MNSKGTFFEAIAQFFLGVLNAGSSIKML